MIKVLICSLFLERLHTTPQLVGYNLAHHSSSMCVSELTNTVPIMCHGDSVFIFVVKLKDEMA